MNISSAITEDYEYEPRGRQGETDPTPESPESPYENFKNFEKISKKSVTNRRFMCL
jgi:hypothetical protein